MKVSLGEQVLEIPSHREKGRFVIHWRNRMAGHEMLFTRELPGQGIRIIAETSLAVPRLELRQVVTADYDRTLRPRRCVLRSELNQRALSLDMKIAENEVQAVTRLERRTEAKTIPLRREPVLILDHCFALHALAGYRARGGLRRHRTFTAVPAFEVLRVIPGPGERVLIGGETYPSPSLSLQLSPNVREHIWFEGEWAKRLIIPSAHLRAEWKDLTRKER